MQFAIGTYTFPVRRRWNLSVDGERCNGLCSLVTHTIWLDGELAEEHMVEVLRHEYFHGLEYQWGAGRHDEESRAQFFATAAGTFEKEFAAQGGLAALLEIPIEGNRPGKRPPITYRNLTDRIDCGRCGSQIMSGSIFTGVAELNEEVGIFLVPRGATCPVCDCTMTWMERSTPSGIPLGEFHQPKILDGAEAAEWLSAHAVHAPYNVA